MRHLQHFEVDKREESCYRMCDTSLRWRHLVNAYGVKALVRLLGAA